MSSPEFSSSLLSLIFVLLHLLSCALAREQPEWTVYFHVARATKAIMQIYTYTRRRRNAMHLLSSYLSFLVVAFASVSRQIEKTSEREWNGRVNCVAHGTWHMTHEHCALYKCDLAIEIEHFPRGCDRFIRLMLKPITTMSTNTTTTTKHKQPLRGIQRRTRDNRQDDSVRWVVFVLPLSLALSRSPSLFVSLSLSHTFTFSLSRIPFISCFLFSGWPNFECIWRTSYAMKR